MTRILLLGKSGQLGWELQRSLAPLGEVIALDRGGGKPPSREPSSSPLCGDLGRPEQLAATVLALRPQVIVNAAAYTAVDRAESESEVAYAVNALAPGWFPSEMTEGWFAIPQFLERFTGQAPMLRIGDPDELAGPLLFLASDASSFVTGQVLAVDGGLSATTGGTPYTDELFGLQASVVPGGLGERILPT